MNSGREPHAYNPLKRHDKRDLVLRIRNVKRELDAKRRLRRFVRGLTRPIPSAFVSLIEAVAVGIVGWGSAWDRARGRGQSANNTARHLAWYAWRRIESEDLRGARYFARTAIAADRGYADGYRILAQAYDRSDDRTTAREVCERGLRRRPDDASLWQELGAVEARAERLDAAEAPWRRAMELRPDEPRVMRRMAGLLESQRRWREALPLLQRIHELEPGDNTFLIRLARARVNTGAFDKAEELLRGVIATEPSSADAHYWLAISLAGMNRWDQAIEQARLAVQLAPDDEHYRKIHDLFRETGGKDLVFKLDDRSITPHQGHVRIRRTGVMASNAFSRMQRQIHWVAGMLTLMVFRDESVASRSVGIDAPRATCFEVSSSDYQHVSRSMR